MLRIVYIICCFRVDFSLFGLLGCKNYENQANHYYGSRRDFQILNPETDFREQVGGTHLATKGGTVAILAQGTSWAVAVTQAFLAAVQIPRVWVLKPRGFKIGILATPREDRLGGRRAGFIFCYFLFCGFWGAKFTKLGQTYTPRWAATFNF